MTEVSKDYLDSLKTIKFSEWRTEVENDDLAFVGLGYGGYERIEYVKDGFSIELGLADDESDGALEATFISREKKAGVKFSFANVSAFRVLDEHGLVDLWNASKLQSRPAQTTFKVKGHKWQTESELSWLMPGCEYSFMIATGWNCLEVIANCEPTITLLPAVVREIAVH